MKEGMEEIVLAAKEEIGAVGALYDRVLEYFETHENYCYPNWRKGYYPTFDTAQAAFEEGNLYVLKIDGIIAGTVIIDSGQHPEYKKIPWSMEVPDSQVMIIKTLAVDPRYRNQGIGEKLVKFCVERCRLTGAKTIRMDTHYANIPARRLYVKCGFRSLGCWKARVEGIDQEFDVFEYIK